jgi:Hemolysin coregulated protein Hcp (TssD)/Lysine-specific metallo-endopeptidase
MASFAANFYLEGKVYQVLMCQYDFRQYVDHRGRPRSKVRKGPIWLELWAGGNYGELADWATDAHKTLSGYIDFTRIDSESTFAHFWFTHAYCVGHHFHFDSTGATGEPSLRLFLVIAPDDMGRDVGNGQAWVAPPAREHGMVPGDGGSVSIRGMFEDAWNDLNDNYITDKKKLATLKQALENQKKQLLAKQAALKRWNEADIECFTNTFGRSFPKDRTLVQGRVNQQLKLVDDFLKKDTYKQKFFASSETGSIAHVRRYGPDHEIFLSEKYWLYDPENQSCILAHEMSHWSDKANLNDYGKYGYGARACKQLALNNEEMALDNADNFRFYLQGDLCK